LSVLLPAFNETLRMVLVGIEKLVPLSAIDVPGAPLTLSDRLRVPSTR
jgi:hypothetical protein